MEKTKISNSFINSISSPRDVDNFYNGKIIFGDRTIYFSGTSLLANNVAKYEKFSYKTKNNIPNILWVISMLITLAAVMTFLESRPLQDIALIVGSISGIVAFIGFMERVNQNTIYGLMIEMNSGSRHLFTSKDKDGLHQLFILIAKKLEAGEPIKGSVVVGKMKVKMNLGDTYNVDENKGAVGKDATFNN